MNIETVKSFRFKRVIANKGEVTYEKTGKKKWTAPVYSYEFQDQDGNSWWFTESALENYLTAGIIYGIE